MSERKQKKIRKEIRKNGIVIARDFILYVNTLNIKQRISIAFKIIFKRLEY